MIKNVKAISKKYCFEQYSVLTSTYDQRMTSIQNVIIINTTFASAVIVVLSVELNIFNILFGTNYTIDSKAMAACALSFIAFVQSLFCLISIIFQTKSCTDLRKQLLHFEETMNLYKMHEKNNLKIPICLTIISNIVTCGIFLLCFFVSLSKITHNYIFV